MNTIAEKLASFAIGLSYEQIPKEVVSKAKMCILDCFANMLASGTKFSNEQLAAIIGKFPQSGESTIFGLFQKRACLDAVFINSIMARYLDIDDGDLEARGHPGTVIVPSSLAIGEMYHATGKEVLAALVAGYDVYLKIGKLINPIHRNRGFDTTGTGGVFSAATVASKIMKMDLTQIVSALGIAGSLAAGLNEYHSDGSMTKLLHSGFGSRNGIFSAFLSQSGMTGPKAVIEGNEGFIHALVGDVDEDHKTEIVSSIGNKWEIMDLYFKRYGCLRRTHTVVDAAIYIAENNDLDIEAIERIEVHASSFVVELGAKTPQTLVDGQGSIPFCVALALVFKKAGIDEFSVENINDPKIVSLSKKVSLHIDPQFEQKFRGNQQSAWSSRVKLKLTSGKELSHTVIYPSGDPENPIPEEELINKFNDMASHALQKINTQRLKEIIFEFEAIEDLSTFYDEIME